MASEDRCPRAGNATAACLLIGRREKGDRDAAITVVVITEMSTVLTVLPAPAVGTRTSRSFDQGGQAERVDGTGSRREQKNPRRSEGRGGSTRCPRGDTLHTHTAQRTAMSRQLVSEGPLGWSTIR